MGAVSKYKGVVRGRLYSIWRGMKKRCYCKSDSRFPRYGGRGIKVCDEWRRDYAAFAAWALSHGYADNLSIDRKDNDGDYTPENCRFSTAVEQSNNKRNNKRFYINGRIFTLSQLSRQHGVGFNRLKKRLYRGWRIERAAEFEEDK